jgi:hypothetical protein
VFVEIRSFYRFVVLGAMGLEEKFTPLHHHIFPELQAFLHCWDQSILRAAKGVQKVLSDY